MNSKNKKKIRLRGYFRRFLNYSTKKNLIFAENKFTHGSQILRIIKNMSKVFYGRHFIDKRI